MLQIGIICSYFLTFLKSTSRYRVKILDAVLLVFAAMLFSFRNVKEADTVIYNLVYYYVGNGAGFEIAKKYGLEYGFYLLMKGFSGIGVSFVAFRMTLFLTSCFLILSTVKLITKNKGLVLCLYLYFPFGYDSDQIRQFLAYAIVMFAIRYLISENKHPVKYVAFVLLASFLHTASVAFLIYLLVLIKDREKVRKTSCMLCCFLSLFAMLGGNIIGIVGSFFNNEKFLRYSLASTSYRMNVYLQIFEIGMVFLMLFTDNYILRRRKDEADKALNTILFLSSLFLPLVLYSLAFERVLRPFIILTYAVVVSEYDKREESRRHLYLAIIIALIIIRMSVTFGYVTDMFNDCTLFAKNI